MTLTSTHLRPKKGSTKSKKRIGRGSGSGLGTYSGRGLKGQKARKGKKIHAWFEGGQTSFLQKMPKLKGFKNPNRVEHFSINLTELEEKFSNKDIVTTDTLCEKGILSKKDIAYKILGNGEIKKELHLKISKISESAKKKIEQAKGSVEIVNKFEKKTKKEQ